MCFPTRTPVFEKGLNPDLLHWRQALFMYLPDRSMAGQYKYAFCSAHVSYFISQSLLSFVVLLLFSCVCMCACVCACVCECSVIYLQTFVW